MPSPRLFRANELIRKRATIGAHLAGGGVDAILVTIEVGSAVLDAFVTSEATIAGPHDPTQRDKRLAGFDRNACFKAQHAFEGIKARSVFTHGLRRALVVPARAVAGGLHVEPVVDAVEDDLRLALRLHVAAHHAEGHPGLAVLAGEARDDGLKGALAGRVDVGVAILE